MVGLLGVKRAVPVCLSSNPSFSTQGDYGSRNTLRILSLLQDEGLEGTVSCWQWFEARVTLRQ